MFATLIQIPVQMFLPFAWYENRRDFEPGVPKRIRETIGNITRSLRCHTFYVPTEIVVTEPGVYTPKTGRIWAIEGRAGLALGLPVEDMSNAFMLAEYMTDQGSDGHTDYQLGGYVVVPWEGPVREASYANRKLSLTEQNFDVEAFRQWSHSDECWAQRFRTFLLERRGLKDSPQWGPMRSEVDELVTSQMPYIVNAIVNGFGEDALAGGDGGETEVDPDTYDFVMRQLDNGF